MFEYVIFPLGWVLTYTNLSYLLNFPIQSEMFTLLTCGVVHFCECTM